MSFRRGVSSSHEAEADEVRIDAELSRLITEVTNEVSWRMREDGMTRADLAGRMGVSPGRVSQVLSGGRTSPSGPWFLSRRRSTGGSRCSSARTSRPTTVTPVPAPAPRTDKIINS